MEIRKATIRDLNKILYIVHTTIETIYPNYYPLEVVDYFIKHHKEESIIKDLAVGTMYVIKVEEHIVGTGSIDGHYIGRVYILPEYQGKGFGTVLLKYLEKEIAKDHSKSVLHASLPSYDFYLKHGYEPKDYHKLQVENQRMLCYLNMEKVLV